MRATRAYLAAFGTSGSLLAGAALMFVVASAIVGFQGWPQIGGQSPITNVAAPRVAIAPSSPASRILATLSPRTAAGLATRSSLAGAKGPGGGAGSASSGGLQPAPNATGSAGVRGVVSTACAGAGCRPAVAASGPSAVTGPVSRALAGTGKRVGSAVSGATNAAANAVAPVSPAAANTIRRIGHGTSQTVTTVATTAANAVANAGSGLSHLHP